MTPQSVKLPVESSLPELFFDMIAAFVEHDYRAVLACVEVPAPVNGGVLAPVPAETHDSNAPTG